MGFVKPHITILVAGGAVGVALLFQIIGLATVGWFVEVPRRITLQHAVKWDFGLWKVCPSAGGHCVDKSAPADFEEACRAFGILGVLAMAAALAFALLICFMNEKKIFFLAAPVAAAAGALCTLIEFSVYAGKASEGHLTDYLGYSFALTIVACVLCVVATVLFFLGRGRTA